MAVFVAVEAESAVFDCETAPPFPALSMRTGPFVFVAPSCAARESDNPSCPTSLDCPVAWTAVPEQPQPPALCCAAVCVTGAAFVASAREVASFDCVTEPSSPAEPIRTGVFVFVGAICSAVDAAMSVWSTVLVWPIACTGLPPVVQPQDRPAPVCVADWVVGAVFVVFAVDVALLDCETLPPFPGLWIRTETFEFLGRSCVALESAAPVCVVVASCVADCTPEPPPAWFPVCAVVALFVAVALEVALFDCETAPSSPGERIRTETFEFVGCVCVASDAAAASWVVVAFCVVDWTPPSPDGACCADVCVVGAVFVADPDEAASFACVAGAAAGAGAAVAACIAAPRTSPRRPDVTTGTA